MPVYEYRCRKCDEVFERMLSVAEHERTPPRCPNCNSEDVKAVLTPFFAKTSRKS